MDFDLQPTLKGELLTLRPLGAKDFEPLFQVASDPLVWEQHPRWDRYKEEVFRPFFQAGLNSGGALVAVEGNTQSIIGSSRFLSYSPSAQEVEIGFTFLGRDYWGGTYNGEMKRLMLRHAFQTVGSVVFLIGQDNVRSKRSVEKIGAKFDGERKDATGLDAHIYRIRKGDFKSSAVNMPH